MSLRTRLLSLFLLLSLISCTNSPPIGELMEGHLRPCPNRPNCVNSERGDSAAIDSAQLVAPISFYNSPEEAWLQIQIIIQDLGGEISEKKPLYLWATFTSTFFDFIDDLELRLEPEENQIHIRSGARVGFYDFGVNRTRVEKIQQIFSNPGKREESR